MKKGIVIMIISLVVIAGCFVSQRKENAGKPGSEAAAKAVYKEYCSGCHGEQMEAFVDRKWKFGNAKDSIIHSINYGAEDLGMPAYKDAIDKKNIEKMAALMVEYITHVDEYSFEKKPTSNVFVSEGMTVKLDTIASEMQSPWGFAQLPDGNYLISDKTGELYLVDQNRQKTLIKNSPKVLAEGQGGLMDIELHPDYAKNEWVYITYSKFKEEGEKKLTSTALIRARLKGNALADVQEIFVADPYTTTRHHFGAKIMFDDKGYLFLSVGERGKHDEFPQKTDNDNGKIHRMNDDGSVPADNPFANDPKSKSTIWSYGHRNPQGLYFDKTTGILWETEHGPRGGDELNIIHKATNYGWPVITYGINYNGKPMTNISKKEGMEQPVIYWTPSIAPCGMEMVTGDRYPAWKGNIMVGSLRFKYLNRCVIDKDRVVKQEKLLANIGRLRNVKMGNDGYLYVSVEKPGYVFRLVPVN